MWKWKNDPWLRAWIVGLVAFVVAAIGKLLFNVPSEASWDSFGLTGVVLAGFLVAIVVWIPTSAQSRLLSQIEQERQKYEYYDSLIGDCRDGESDERSGMDPSQSMVNPEEGGHSPNEKNDVEPGSPDSQPAGGTGGSATRVAMKYRCRMAADAIEKATEAVIRRDYAEALRLAYEASRHNFILSDVLGVNEPSDSQPNDPDDNETATDGGAENSGSERTENLVTRLLSFVDKMPSSRAEMVEEYIDTEGSTVSPFDLYYALEVMHEWNVKQRNDIQNKKRYFRFAIGLLVLLGVGLSVLVWFNGEILDAILAVNSEGNSQPEVGTGSLVALVLLVGGTGALFSVLLTASMSLGNSGTDPSVPGSAFVYEALLLRVLVGSIGALLFTVLIQTSVMENTLNLSFILGTDDSGVPNPKNLVIIAFFAGFSEKLIKSSLDEIISTTLETEDSGTGRPSGDGESDQDGPAGDEIPDDQSEEDDADL